MKKLICLFLMFWLPLFMGSAWAMNMQMELQNQLPQSSNMASHTQASADMPQHCHMANNKMPDKKTSQPHPKCAACGMCAIANASASFNTVPNFDLPKVSPHAPILFKVAFTSTDLPPNIKPPILN